MKFIPRFLLACLLSFAILGFIILNLSPTGAQGGFVDPSIGGSVYQVVLQPDGKILVAGAFATAGGQPRSRVARLNSDGTLDPSFQDPEVVGTDPFNNAVYALALQPDGKVLIGGLIGSVGGLTRAYMARLNPNGSVDESFSSSVSNTVIAIAVQPDGKILIAGYFDSVQGQPMTKLARLNPDGTLDTSFQNPVITSVSGYAVGTVALQADGKVLIGGYFNSVGGQARSYGARLNYDGSVDAGFGLAMNGGPVEDFAVLPGGKIAAAGFFNSVNGTSRRVVVRLNEDGSIDPTFQEPNISSGNITEIDALVDGRLVIGGNFSSVGGQARRNIARLNANGTLDAGFVDPNTNFGGDFSYIGDLKVQADGKTLIGGQFTTIGHRPRNNLVRLMPDGTVEQGMGTSVVVTKTTDTNDGTCNADCSLREAVAFANTNNAGTVINFDPVVFSSPQTISLSLGQLAFENGRLVSLNGPGASLLTISGNETSRILLVKRDVNATINGVTLANGNGIGPGFAAFNDGGAIFVEPNGVITSLSIANSVLRNNRANSGGAIATFGTSSMTISNTTIADNTATYNPGVGGILFYNGTLTISDSIIRGNASTFGNGDGPGGLSVGDAVFTLTGTVIHNNTGHSGGGIGVGGNATISNTTIRNNQSTTGSGGLGVGPAAIVTLANSSVYENNATSTDSRGGGIQNYGRLTIMNSAVRNNSANLGGGIFAAGGLNTDGLTLINNTAAAGGGVYNNVGGSTGLPVTITRSVISGNSSTGFGGGIYNRDPFFISESTVSSNTAGANGGGAFNVFLNVGNAAFSAARSTFNGNTAVGGAGVSNQSGTVQLTNSTVSGNIASGSGGGVNNNNNGTIDLANTTIAFNRSNSLSGGINNSATVNSRNSIIAANTAGTQSLPSDFRGPLNAQGYNLIGTTSGTQITGVTTGNIVDQNAQLDPVLRNNGGQTLTHRLLGGRAIDGGDPADILLTDQRGVSRPLDGNADGTARADIGAFEVRTVSVTNISDSGAGSLRQAIADVSATGDSVVFDASLFGTPKTITLTGGELSVPQDATVTISGPGADKLTISGNNQSRVMYIRDGANVSLAGLSITGGNGIGFVSGRGGAIYNSSSTLILLNCVVFGNTAQEGGGIHSGEYPGGGVFRSINSTIRNNTATAAGGGAFVLGDESEFSGSFVIQNTADSGGGGVSSYIANNLKFSNSTISDNSGGGIYVGSGTTASVINSTVSNNTRAGGIRNSGGLIVQRSLISGNSSFDPGGGIFNESDNAVSVSNTTISGNTSPSHGGGFFNANAVGEAVSIESSTIAFNHTDGIGGGVFNSLDKTINVRNTIIANNTATIHAPDFERTLTSQGYNLIRDTTGTTIAGVTTGNILGQDPLLDPVLRQNGGPTLTHALRLASPAADKGGAVSPSVTVDQRGFARPVNLPTIPNAPSGNGSDIGAYERGLTDFTRTEFDYDADRMADLSVRRPSDNVWYILRGLSGYMAMEFGEAGDILAPADYDGDAKTDVAVFRPSNGTWYIFNSQSQSFSTVGWGESGDVPVPADHDGDGKADLVVFRQSTGQWFTRFSLNNSFSTVGFGVAGDKPVVGDFDGDGKADIALFRPSDSNWYILKTGFGFFIQTWGEAGDIPAPADYDGDGATDVAVFRPSTGQWFRIRSTAGFDTVNWGANGDKPIPADYDGDGKSDVAVFRPSNATWYIVGSTSGQLIQNYGAAGDLPTQGAFIY